MPDLGVTISDSQNYWFLALWRLPFIKFSHLLWSQFQSDNVPQSATGGRCGSVSFPAKTYLEKPAKPTLPFVADLLGVNSSPQLILLSYCLWPNILQSCLEIFEIYIKRTLPTEFTMFTNITSRASWMTIVTRRNVTTIASTQFSFLEGWVTVSALRL